MGYYLQTDTRTCVTVCPDGQYKDSNTRTCQPCHPDCDTCVGPRDTQCSRCKSGSYYFQRKCTKQGCPMGYFADLYISECAPCPKGCHTCSAPDSCELCEPGWSLVNRKLCTPSMSTAKCPQGGAIFYSNHTGQCEACSSLCGTCFDGSKDGCLSCNPETNRPLLHINSCIEGHHCPDSTFQFNNECRHCAHACNKCSSLQKCDTCHPGYYLTDTGHCVPDCPLGQYPDEGMCKSCPLLCKACLNATVCSECPDKTPFLMSDGSCADRCPLGTYQEQNRCLPCHGSCLSCSGPERINCLSCPAGTRLHDYICQSCALGTYYESLSNKCNKCHQGCSTCSGPLTSDCMSCMDPNLHLDENNTCVPCCNTLDPEESSENCCPCDEKNMKCLVEKDLEHNGSKKRRSNGHMEYKKGTKKGIIIMFWSITQLLMDLSYFLLSSFYLWLA